MNTRSHDSSQANNAQFLSYLLTISQADVYLQRIADEHASISGLPTKDNLTPGEQFLLQDFNFMGDYSQESIRTADKRADILLTLTSAIAGGVLLLNQVLHPEPMYFILLIFACSIAVATIGFTTLLQIIDLTIHVGECTRALNRIRKYFSIRSNHIRNYLLMPTSYTYPPYEWRSGSQRIVLLIISTSLFLVASTFVLLLNIMFFNNKSPEKSMFVIFFFSFLIGVPAFYKTLQWRTHQIFQNAENIANSVRLDDDHLLGSHEDIDLKLFRDPSNKFLIKK